MRMHPLFGLGAVALSAGLFLACGDKADSDEDTDTDVDTDADTDTDTDTTGTDTDTDTDTTGTDTDTDTDTTGTDTDTDTDTTVAVEDCSDGSDNDDDGLADCEDPDCTDECAEDCSDGLDNDADDAIDCYDSECVGTEACTEQCTGGEDEDLDGDIDCADADCAEDRACTADFFGSLTYKTSIESVTACDIDVSLIGGEYVGDCEGCDFAFILDPSITRDDSTSDCYVDPVASMVGDELYTPTYLGYWSTFDDYYYGAIPNVMAVGFGYYFYGYTYPGPYWSFVAADLDSDYFGSASFADRTLTWDLGSEYDYYMETYRDYCDYDYEFSSETVPATGGYSATGDFACGGDVIDVWTFSADGGDISISVDTVAEATTFDPYMWVNGPDECIAVYADDNFSCTYPPPSYSCPTWTGALTAGDYQLVVASFSTCAGETGEYRIDIDHGSDPGLTLFDDDAAAETVELRAWENKGSGTVNIDLSGGGDTGSSAE